MIPEALRINTCKVDSDVALGTPCPIKPPPTPSRTPRPTLTPSPTPKATVTPSKSQKSTPTPSKTNKPTPTPSRTAKPTPTPTVSSPPPIQSNYANYLQEANWNGTSNGNLTTVGSNGGPSFYGTYDQSGNVFEWNDLAGAADSSRGLRGGNWNRDAFHLSSSGRITNVPSIEGLNCGFRLASRSSTLNPLNLSNFVTVGDANNSNDSTGFGGVSYTYQIGKYPVTNCEYVEFLNAVASTDDYGLYSTDMDSNVAGGITRAGSSGSYAYSAKPNMGNKPVVDVSWFDCARYCNWLHNGKGSGDTETGAYTLNGRTTGEAVVTNANANYHIPTENEWYKAAYYKGGGTNAGYWTYATQSDTAPTPVQANSVGDGQINGGSVPGSDPINISCGSYYSVIVQSLPYSP